MHVENVSNKTVPLFIRLKLKSHVNFGNKVDIVVKVKTVNFITQLKRKRKKIKYSWKRTKIRVNKKYKEISLAKKRMYKMIKREDLINLNNKVTFQKNKKSNKTIQSNHK